MSDAREAYIAGRSGGSKPPPRQTRGSDPSETQRNTQEQKREQKAFDAGQQERQRAQTIKEEGIAGLSQREREQAKKIAQNVAKQGQFKDPYNVLTRKEEIEAGYPKTGIEKLQEITGTKIISPTIQLMAGAGKIGQALLDKIFKPSVEDFNDPVVLASINRLFEEKGEEFKTSYLNKYKDKIQEAFNPQLPFEQEQGFGIIDEAGVASLFDKKLKKAVADAKSGDLGKGVQRINFPEEFYTGSDARKSKGVTVMPQTVDGLENLARLDAQKYSQGENYNPKLAQMIFNAREELARQKGERTRYTGLGSYMGEEPVAGGAGIPDNLANQTFMEDKMDISRREPSLTLGYGPGDMPYTAVIPREGYRYTHDEAGRRYEIPIGYNPLGDAFGTTYGGEQFGWRPNPWDMQPVEQTPATGVASLAPTTINYASMAPQFGPQYRGYVNQGINDPQFASYFKNLQMFPRIV